MPIAYRKIFIAEALFFLFFGDMAIHDRYFSVALSTKKQYAIDDTKRGAPRMHDSLEAIVFFMYQSGVWHAIHRFGTFFHWFGMAPDADVLASPASAR